MITYAIVAACFVFCAVYNGMPGGSSLLRKHRVREKEQET